MQRITQDIQGILRWIKMAVGFKRLMSVFIGVTISIISSSLLLPLPSASAFTINISGAVGLYLENNELKQIDASGNTSLVIEENPCISRIYESPSDILYIVFCSPEPIDGNSYILAQLDPSAGTFTGIDSSMDILLLGSFGSGSISPYIQFDSSGNIYYFTYSSGNTVLRRYTDKDNITDLINQGMSINEWLVLSDGTVVFSGTTNATSVRWLRKLSPGGSLSNIVVGIECKFILEFPDGRIYVGLWSDPYFGVYRLPSDLSALTDHLSPYIGEPDFNGIAYTPEYNHDQIFGMGGFFGTSIGSYFQTTDGKIIVLKGWPGSYVVAQYYPTVQKTNLSLIDSPTILKGKQDQLFIAGTKSGTNKLIQYSTSDGNEVGLLSEDIEVYHLDFVGDNDIYFDGLRFSDNKYIISKLSAIASPDPAASGFGLSNAELSFDFSSYEELTQTSSRLNNFYAIDSSDVTPDIKANRSDVPVTINPADTLSITISLAAGSSLNANADWWLLASTPFAPPNDWYSYDISGTWNLGFLVAYQGAISNLGSTQILNIQGLPEGAYTFYFGVDIIMNGTVDTGSGQLFYDSVVVDIVK